MSLMRCTKLGRPITLLKQFSDAYPFRGLERKDFAASSAIAKIKYLGYICPLKLEASN